MIKRVALAFFFIAAAVAHADTFPVIEEITPTQGAVEGGTVVTLRGKNLARPASPLECSFLACVPSVSFVGKRATLVDVADDGTRVRFRTPANAGGTYDVTFEFRVRSTFGTQVILGAAIGGGVTLKRAFTYGSGGYERVLVPIFAKGETPGAFGSRWVTELVGWNPHFFSVGVYQTPPATPPAPFTSPEWGAAESSFRLPLTGPGTALMYVTGTATLGFTLRVRDLSRQSESWGTEIPVVPESHAIVGAPILLNDIPYDADSRVMLRIYDFDGPTGGGVDVEVHFDDARPNESFALAQEDFPSGAYQEFPPIPGFIQLDLTSELSAIPPAKGAKALRIAVNARNGSEKRLWAFVTVTNNKTQQITTITPNQ